MGGREKNIRNYERKIFSSRSFTSHPGGNLVDGLPPASSTIILQGLKGKRFRKTQKHIVVTTKQ